MKVLRQYADFEGRARRKEYWMFFLINFLISIGFTILASIAGSISNGLAMIFSSISMLYSLAVLIPGIAVGIRRLHDIGKSGWMLLVAFIPIAGAIWLIVLLATEGDHGTNEYGADPKGFVDDFQTA